MFDPEQSRVIFACLGPYAQKHIPFMLGGLGLLVAVTLALYTLIPVWICHRWRASALREDDVPGLSRELRALVSRVGLRRAPLFLWNPMGTVPAARAFGAFGRHRVTMTGALLAQYFTEPAGFRAVLLHELAHLRNGDVTKAMLAMAVWWAFVITVLPPFFAVAISKPFDLIDNAYSLLRLVAFTALVLLTRNSVLRARELYADARASAYERDGLADVLKRLGPMARWRRFVSPHPLPARRLALLEQTDELFEFGKLDAFGLGAATGILALLTFFITAFAVVGPDLAIGSIEAGGASLIAHMLLLLVPLSVVVLFGVATAAVVTWRSVFLAIMRGRRNKGIFGVSFTFAAGVAVSVSGLVLLPALDPIVARYATLPAATTVIPLLLAIILTSLLLLGSALTMCLSWVAASAAAWLPFLLHRGGAGVALSVSVAVACLLAALTPFVGAAMVWVVIKPVGQAGSTGLLAGVWHLALVGSAFPFNLTVWPIMIVLRAWPFAPAWLGRLRGNPDVRHWAWLDPASAEIAPPLARLWLGRAALIGVLGGTVFGLALDRLSQSLPEEWARAASLHGEAASVVVRMMLAAILVQAMLAALSVFAVSRLRSVHAIFASNIAGLVLAIAIRLHQLANPGWGRPGVLIALEALLQPVIIGGALAALPTAMLLQVLLSLARSLSANVRRIPG
jgi:Zn-dependent protease with chaperone function